MNTVYLHLGSNKNEPLKQLLIAFGEIEHSIGKISAYSRYYKTEAWGNTDQEDFINVAIEVNTPLDGKSLMKELLSIENKMGRVRSEKWGPRLIDIDIIFYNLETMNEKELTFPHKEMKNRNFVLVPLSEIAGDLIHPVLLKSVNELRSDCKDQSKVVLL